MSITVPVFFDRKSINQRKRKPKALVFHIYHCCKYGPEIPSGDSDELDGDGDTGAWCYLIVQQPQDSFNASATNAQTTYMVSAIDVNTNHVRIRLNGLLESLKWIVGADATEHSIETVFISTDVFIVSILREWIPKWRRTNFRMGKGSDEKRPNSDLLEQISDLIVNMKLTVSWQDEYSNEMETISKKIDDMLSQRH